MDEHWTFYITFRIQTYISNIYINYIHMLHIQPPGFTKPRFVAREKIRNGSTFHWTLNGTYIHTIHISTAGFDGAPRWCGFRFCGSSVQCTWNAPTPPSIRPHSEHARTQTLIHYPGNAFCMHANTDLDGLAAAASNCNAHNNNNEDVIEHLRQTMQCISRTIVRWCG